MLDSRQPAAPRADKGNRSLPFSEVNRKLCILYNILERIQHVRKR